MARSGSEYPLSGGIWLRAVFSNAADSGIAADTIVTRAQAGGHKRPKVNPADRQDTALGMPVLAG